MLIVCDKNVRKKKTWLLDIYDWLVGNFGFVFRLVIVFCVFGHGQDKNIFVRP